MHTLHDDQRTMNSEQMLRRSAPDATWQARKRSPHVEVRRFDVEVRDAEVPQNSPGIPPELGVVSKLVKIKCDLIFGCKHILVFNFVINYLIFEC